MSSAVDASVAGREPWEVLFPVFENQIQLRKYSMKDLQASPQVAPPPLRLSPSAPIQLSSLKPAFPQFGVAADAADAVVAAADAAAADAAAADAVAAFPAVAVAAAVAGVAVVVFRVVAAENSRRRWPVE